MATLRVQSSLRAKNQITLPDAIVKRLGVHEGDRFVFVLEDSDQNVEHLHRLRESYAGALAGVYGSTPQEIADYLEQEREAWGE
jgi:bifunctional DNA-binding transcriptional regulator/antitoxin component of YhaV-PrlF toxin-antitoxin module